MASTYGLPIYLKSDDENIQIRITATEIAKLTLQKVGATGLVTGISHNVILKSDLSDAAFDVLIDRFASGIYNTADSGDWDTAVTTMSTYIDPFLTLPG